MELDAVLLARLQFAFTIGFHYLFPPLTIGLGLLMVIMEGRYLMTGDRIYESMAKFWTKMFALIFAIGVASGIVMEFQFGTNWETYSRYVGDIFGAALAAEGIFAFFLESGFLAVLVFGWDRVSSKMHFFATLMVSLGSMFSAVWIIIANSWQQTPAGFKITTQEFADGTSMPVAELTDFWAAILNPSTIERLTHTLIGAFIAAGFLVISVSAYYLLKQKHTEFAKKCIGIALPFAMIFSITALISGHSQAQNVGKTQPAKLAAFEGLYETTTSAPLYIFGWPNSETETVTGLAIPGMLSFLTHNDFSAEVIGLDQFPQEDRPPVWLPFQSYHLMVGLGMFFIGITVLGNVLMFTGKLYNQKWLLRIFVVAVIGPMIANEVGWIAAEVGRQPWIVYPTYEAGNYMAPIGGLRTAEAASRNVAAWEILTSMILVGVIYTLLFIVWLYVLDQKIKTGPESPEQLEQAANRRSKGWFSSAAEFAEHTGHLMRDTHEEKPESESER